MNEQHQIDDYELIDEDFDLFMKKLHEELAWEAAQEVKE